MRQAALMLRAVATALLGGALLLGAAPHAAAGDYRVYSCATPDGAPSGIDGWSAINEAPAAAVATGWTTINRCPSGTGLAANLIEAAGAPTWSAGERVGWRFTAPAGATLRSIELRGYASGFGPLGSETGAVYGTFGLPDEVAAPGRCEAPGCTLLGDWLRPESAENLRSFNATGGRFSVLTGCAGAAGAWCDAAQQRANAVLWRATIQLRDDASPTAAAIGGELLDAGARRGLQGVAFTAQDQGAGVRRAELLVDGSVVATAEPPAVANTCADAGFLAGEPHEYRTPQPCPASFPVVLAVDTTRLGDGPHAVQASVIDASGNRATVLDRVITVGNARPPEPPASGGTPSSAAAPIAVRLDGGDAATLRSAYGKPLLLGGIVLDAVSKAPRPGVVVAVSQRVLRTGAPWAPLGQATSGADGRFALAVPTTASRLLRIEAPGVLLERKLEVQAGLTIGARPATLRRGATLELSGKVRLAELPRRGVRIEIQSRWGKRWRTIDAVQSTRRGSWRWRYRVTKARGVLPFRAVLVPSSDVAASGGTSRVVRVRAR